VRHFLYVDNELVNSIIAQQGKGLVSSFTTEKERGVGKTKKRTGVFKTTVGAEADVIKLARAEASIDIGATIEGMSSNTEVTKRIFAKTLHDAAYDLAYKAIKAVKITEIDESISIGKYVELKRNYDFIDFEYLEQLFTPNGIVELIKKSDDKTIRKNAGSYINNNLNREQRRANSKEISNRVNEITNQRLNQYDDIHEVLLAIGKAIPYGRMLVTNDGFLIPLEERHFRINPASFGFMYGGEIVCVGMITNVIAASSENDVVNVFSSLQTTLYNSIMQLIPTCNNKFYVISPMAIYYEDK